MNAQKYSTFADKVTAQIGTSAPIAETCLANLRPSLIWTARHLDEDQSQDCSVLLKGAYGAAVEAVSLVSFGLIRPAILSLRSHYELSLQYLFYKDHPVEWRNVRTFRTQPNLPSINKKFLRDNYSGFEDRFKLLLKVKVRPSEDCYEILSGVAHGTAINSISSATSPEQLIETEQTVSQAPPIFQSVGEQLSDIQVACFESNWLSLPEDTQTDLNTRFGDKNPRTELNL
jgi:hypothetical protein